MMSNHSYPPDKCTFELLSAYLDGEVTAGEQKTTSNRARGVKRSG